jgi:NADH-quinone oxidoreductase subunit N
VTGLHLIYPELALSLMALGLMVADLFVAARHGKILYHMAWIATAITLCLVGFTISNSVDFQGVGSLWAVDPMSQFFKVLVLLATIMALLLGLEYKGLPIAHSGSFVALLLFSAVGMMFLVSAKDLLLVFIALELVSISSFIMAGFERGHAKSNEGAMKYFIFGSFSSAIMIYGISLYYGAAGTTDLLKAPHEGALLIVGLLFILVGFGFKASIAPMHFWVPDAYEGAPTPVTAYLSIAPKIAALGALLRIFGLMIPASSLQLAELIGFLAVLTMTFGNFTAIFQTNLKRLLAYSSVAQAGYMLIGLAVGTATGLEGVLLYSVTYVAMNIGAFAVAIALGNEEGYELEAYDGLAQRNLGLALCMTFFMLSLAGIPPLAGFIGKFYIFSAAMESHHYGLAIAGVINSVVSVYYYVRIVYHMFLRPAKSQAPVTAGAYLYSGIVLALLGIFVFGLFPESLVANVQSSAQILP